MHCFSKKAVNCLGGPEAKQKRQKKQWHGKGDRDMGKERAGVPPGFKGAHSSAVSSLKTVVTHN